MSIRSGTYGLVQNGANTIASLQKWDLEHTRETVDTTVLGASGYRDSIATFGAWSISAEGFWDPDDTTGQVAIQTAMISNSTVTLKVYPSAGTGAGGTPGTPFTGDTYYSGDAYIASYSPGGSFDNAVTASFNFTGTGALTIGTEP